MSTFTVFEVLLFEGRSALTSAQQGAGIEKVDLGLNILSAIVDVGKNICFICYMKLKALWDWLLALGEY